MASKRKSLKIAIFHCAFVYSGGGERIVLEEAKELTKRGYEVEVFAPTVDYKNCYPEMLKELKVKMFLPSFFDKLPMRNALRMIVTSFLAPFLAVNFKNVDVFIGANQPGAWIAFCIAKILKKPYLVYLNQPNRIVYPRPVDMEFGWYTTVKDYQILYMLLRTFRFILLHLDKYSIQLSNGILVNGSYIGGVIENVYSRPVINCPAGSYVNVVGRPKKLSYLLITNRHDPQKRFDFVIKAFAKIAKKQKDLKLIIPGPFTDHTKKLKGLTKRLKIENRVKFLGQVSESKLQDLYKNALVYCYPSPQEDFGLGPLEAGGWGVPSVAWNHGGPTVTVEDGVTGYLANPYDIDDYADKILRLAQDRRLRDKMGKATYLRTKNIFSWQNHIDIFEETIKKLL